MDLGNGWLQRFRNRNGFALRRRTTTAQKDPDQLRETCLIRWTTWTRLSSSEGQVLSGDTRVFTL